MAASVRTWLVVAALACVLTLMLRSADVQAEDAPLSSSPAQKPKCVRGQATPCRVGALLHDPENQEEEGMLNVKARAPSSPGDSNDDYSDPDKPKDPDEDNDGDDLVVVGH